MSTSDIVGYIAGVFIMVSFVPQVVRSYRTRSVGDLSLMMILATLIGTGLWITYGVLTGGRPIIVMNVMFGVLVIMLLLLKLRDDGND